MATVLDLVTDSLTELGYIAAPDTPTDGDSRLALRRLNSLIDQWKAEKLMIYQITRTTWAIVSGTASYTVGSGGAISIVRPMYIQHVNFQDSTPDPDQEYQMAKLTDDDYSMVPAKALTSTLPSSWYYSPTFPLGVLYLFPIPTSSTLTGIMYAYTAIPVFSALSDTVTLPPAYERMIVKNLAMELAPSFKKQPNPMLVQQAANSLAVLKRENFRMEDLQINTPFSQRDFYTIRQG